MTTEPKSAAEMLYEALERHLEVSVVAAAKAWARPPSPKRARTPEVTG